MTIQEVEAKKAQLETTMTTALAAAKVLVPATAEFDEAYGRYLSAKASLAKIPEEITKAKQTENAEAIKAVATTVAAGISQLIDGFKVVELLGQPVIALRYIVDAESKASVIFNPIIRIAATRGKRETKGAGHTTIVAPDGARLSLTKFVMSYATEAEKASPEYKYPHTRVDSKPKFEAFCAGHNLVGFIYEVPDKMEAEAS